MELLYTCSACGKFKHKEYHDNEEESGKGYDEEPTKIDWLSCPYCRGQYFRIRRGDCSIRGCTNSAIGQAKIKDKWRSVCEKHYNTYFISAQLYLEFIESRIDKKEG